MNRIELVTPDMLYYRNDKFEAVLKFSGAFVFC